MTLLKNKGNTLWQIHWHLLFYKEKHLMTSASSCMHTAHHREIWYKFPNEYVMKTRIETFFIITHQGSIETLERLYCSDIFLKLSLIWDAVGRSSSVCLEDVLKQSQFEKMNGASGKWKESREEWPLKRRERGHQMRPQIQLKKASEAIERASGISEWKRV